MTIWSNADDKLTICKLPLVDTLNSPLTRAYQKRLIENHSVQMSTELALYTIIYTDE